MVISCSMMRLKNPAGLFKIAHVVRSQRRTVPQMEMRSRFRSIVRNFQNSVAALTKSDRVRPGRMENSWMVCNFEQTLHCKCRHDPYEQTLGEGCSENVPTRKSLGRFALGGWPLTITVHQMSFDITAMSPRPEMCNLEQTPNPKGGVGYRDGRRTICGPPPCVVCSSGLKELYDSSWLHWWRSHEKAAPSFLKDHSAFLLCISNISA